ncbi:aspartyl-phosphate phosphatase Spo0E family protein [Bacillus sp. S2-R3J1-FB-BA1]|uniref:aspartyl-phosphate phosphatase Spo0E family protein n=1 Tax=Bacillus sp. S2-R3J1-FB-BA1 TaxID=1973490 RepID=UPI000B489ECE|nr:aspartyl-phosphate phosphatase Spo0E family protein [Bacillus sp. S2-R3J1-FB-BA1]
MGTVKRKDTLEKIERDIHMKREEMIQLGLTRGLNSMETIEVSQKMDKLILQYQCCNEKQPPKWLAIIKAPIFQIGYEG